ncbi:MAG: hydroxyacid dehydrogenase [Chloroflexi bacterium]|nr:hydroxyacid dehydrogenase [Chloroflexota bacterium]
MPAQFEVLLEGVGKVIGSSSVSTSDFWEAAQQVHVIIASANSLFDDNFMAKVPALKVISRTGIGVDKVSISAATARGIAVCNAPDVPTRATAEHTIALMFAITKHLHQVDRALEHGERRDFYSQHRAVEIEGLRMGVVGLGRIGQKVARYARGLGMNVMGFDPFLSPMQFVMLKIEYAATLESLLAKADVVSLHLPATTETIGLMNAERLAQMKQGAYLINTARGSLLDESALLAALESGHLHGAGLDVFEPEPPHPDNPLLHRADVVATPHIGGVTHTSRNNFWREAISQAVEVLKGIRPVNLVNPDVWSHFQKP